jgi:hypothetical protein
VREARRLSNPSAALAVVLEVLPDEPVKAKPALEPTGRLDDGEVREAVVELTVISATGRGSESALPSMRVADVNR